MNYIVERSIPFSSHRQESKGRIHPPSRLRLHLDYVDTPRGSVDCGIIRRSGAAPPSGYGRKGRGLTARDVLATAALMVWDLEAGSRFGGQATFGLRPLVPLTFCVERHAALTSPSVGSWPASRSDHTSATCVSPHARDVLIGLAWRPVELPPAPRIEPFRAHDSSLRNASHSSRSLPLTSHLSFIKHRQFQVD